MMNVLRHFGVAVPDEAGLKLMADLQTLYFNFAVAIAAILPDCDETNSALIGLESSMNFALSAAERGPQTT
jgi:hypothetical protein